MSERRPSLSQWLILAVMSEESEKGVMVRNRYAVRYGVRIPEGTLFPTMGRMRDWGWVGYNEGEWWVEDAGLEALRSAREFYALGFEEGTVTL